MRSILLHLTGITKSRNEMQNYAYMFANILGNNVSQGWNH